MRVSEVMTPDVRVIAPDDTIKRAAQMMGEIDAGVLPVGENDRLVGMITDRDIAIRGVGLDKGPDAPVSEVMTEDVRYCFEDEDLEHVTQNMSDIQVRRLPVLNRDKRLVGIVSIGDIAVEHEQQAGGALGGISEPGGQHTQTG